MRGLVVGVLLLAAHTPRIQLSRAGVAPQPTVRWTVVSTSTDVLLEIDTTRTDVGRPRNLAWVRNTYHG
jgi:hypothetical protein